MTRKALKAARLVTASSLTSLANVKAWANVTTTSDDALITRLIGNASRFILNYLNRASLFLTAYSETYDGVGQRAQILRNFPVVSVSSLLILGQSIPSSTGAPNSGYVIDTSNGPPPGRPQSLNLYGFRFPQCAPQAVSASYSAGYAIQNEPQTVPSSGSYQIAVNAPYGSWGADVGVTYANGTPLTAVSANPTAGQYVAPTSTNAFYQFAAADAGKAVLISYSYIPADIEQACMELVAERYNYRSRIGMISKSLGGQETVTFSQKNMSDFVQSLLMPYRNIVPV